jgi:hypothetical protein
MRHTSQELKASMAEACMKHVQFIMLRFFKLKRNLKMPIKKTRTTLHLSSEP